MGSKPPRIVVVAGPNGVGEKEVKKKPAGETKMKKLSDPQQTPVQRVEDLEAIKSALGQAVGEALLKHKQAGNPVAVWRNGQVVWVKPEDIPVLKSDNGSINPDRDVVI
jgi:hypothetical protein